MPTCTHFELGKHICLSTAPARASLRYLERTECRKGKDTAPVLRWPRLANVSVCSSECARQQPRLIPLLQAAGGPHPIMANSNEADLMSIGQHCSVDTCQQLDFLPFKCDCCSKVYCLEHRTYAAHQCPAAGTKECTVFVCPLCAR